MLEGRGWWYFISCSNMIVWLISRSTVINMGMINSSPRMLSLYSINRVFKNFSQTINECTHMSLIISIIQFMCCDDVIILLCICGCGVL